MPSPTRSSIRDPSASGGSFEKKATFSANHPDGVKEKQPQQSQQLLPKACLVSSTYSMAKGLVIVPSLLFCDAVMENRVTPISDTIYRGFLSAVTWILNVATWLLLTIQRVSMSILGTAPEMDISSRGGAPARKSTCATPTGPASPVEPFHKSYKRAKTTLVEPVAMTIDEFATISIIPSLDYLLDRYAAFW